MSSRSSGAERSISPLQATILVFAILNLVMTWRGMTSQSVGGSIANSLRYGDFFFQPQGVQNPQRSSTSDNSTVHILYMLQHAEQLDDWEVSLKSVLLNHPMEHDMTVHILSRAPSKTKTPSDIYPMLKQRLQPLVHWNNTAHQIDVHVHQLSNVSTQYYQDPSTRRLQSIANLLETFHVSHVIIVDWNVLILTHLDHLWHLRRSDLYMQGSGSGITLCNLAMQVDLEKKETADLSQDPLSNYPPELFAKLPPQWDFTLSSNDTVPITQQRKHGLSMIRFNGTFQQSKSLFFDPKTNTRIYGTRDMGGAGLAHYYAQMSWNWTKFVVEAHKYVDHPGHRVRLYFHPQDVVVGNVTS